ncbi:tetratricopeptide repeat protein [Deinococcus arenicola]|uniref:Tetratricopeptide repeat protein n=1 Tax=Deinococcus arenicola TaxID=2994950 RepID=A0ABU4DTN9_9DEIO|nr:tetratricopeptide repeat protein [Deinococcus sp. ZS9-10]MDV6375804.1 tetratricopeptide repeat protein [Deinococcus sp. ZS9-10]
MSDPARSAAPSAVKPAGLPADAAPLPDLAEVIRTGEWRRALAVSRLNGTDTDVQESLEAVFRFQETVRARRYPSARRALADYREALTGGSNASELSVLRHAADPDTLEGALDALAAHLKEPDPLALETGLAPALAQPLTRAEALNIQGVLLAIQDNSEEARTLFEGALEADAGHYRALTNLGNLDIERGDFAAAETKYREVIRLSPDYDGGHHNLGVALRRQGKMGEAVRSIRRGQQLGMKRSKEDTDAEVKAQFASNPLFRGLRWVLIAVVVLVLFLALRGMLGAR